MSRYVRRAAHGLLSGHLHHEQLLLLPGGLDGQDRLPVLVLDHLQSDLRVPALVLRAPEVDLLPLRHDHREVHVFTLPLHAVHRLHVGEVELLDFARVPAAAVMLLVVVLLGRQQQHAVLGQDAVFLLPELQQPVAPFLQQTLLEHFPPVFQHVYPDASVLLPFVAASRTGRVFYSQAGERHGMLLVTAAPRSAGCSEKAASLPVCLRCLCVVCVYVCV